MKKYARILVTIGVCMLVCVGIFSLVACKCSHEWGEWVELTEPNCETQGVLIRVCAKCNNSQFKNVNALGHDEEIDEAQPATCTATGKTEGKHCLRCGKILVEQTEIQSLGHEWAEWIYNENATCLENGTKTAQCSRCGDETTIEAENTALGHNVNQYNYNYDATVDEDGTETGYCIRCGRNVTRIAQGTKGRCTIVMQGFGNDRQKAEYAAMVEAFNNSEYARQNNLTLRMTQFLAESIYVQGIESGSTLSSDNKVDIIFVDDRHFKKWANYGFISDLKKYTYGDIYNEKLNKMWSSIYPRFRYNRNGNTSYADDPLWGVPVDTSPTAIYYNRQAMENVGIIVISVDDEIVTDANFDQYAKEYAGLTAEMKGKNLMDLWNENKIADKFGQYHDTCGNRDNEEQKYQLSGTTTGAGYAADILAQPDEYAGTSKLFVPKKGYFRHDSFNNFIVSDEINSGATVWVNPNENGINDIVKVFNASIEMNWDELEDLARLLSMAQNKVSHNRKDANGRNVATTYGFYTEWWNNYVWSVGGDCLQDLTGEGTWAYGLADWSTNYLVTDNALDKTDANGNKYYLGVNTGTHYKAGDTLKYLDKLNVKAFEPKVDEFGRYEKDEDGNIVFNDGALLIPAWNGGMRVYDVKTGKESDVIGGSPKKYTSDASIRLEIKNNATTDISANPTAKFIALPSSKSAMNRYLGCIGKYLGIMPTTKGAQSGFDTVAQFGDGKIAMVVERGYEIGRLREFTKANDIEWGVAPLPRYKEYKNPQSNDTIVKAQGVYGGHSEATALCITKTSKNADNAWKVIDWLTSDIMIVNGEKERAGQYYKAVAGYIPNQPDIADNSNFINEDEKTLNLDIFFDMLEYEKANEWWYLSDNAWIDTWANPLNNQVRNNEMTAETWFNNYNIVSCRKLIDYSYYFGSDAYKSIYTQGLQRA